MKILWLFVALVSFNAFAKDCGCDKLVQYRDNDLLKLYDIAAKGYDAKKVKLYEEHKNVLLNEIKTIKKDKPLLGADVALVLRLVSTLSDRFIDLTSAAIPGGSTKVIGFGYASLKEVVSGANTENMTYLVVKEGITSNLSDIVAGPLEIAISTGTLIHSLNQLDKASRADQAAIKEVNNIIINIEKEVVKYDILIRKLREGNYNFLYLNKLKDWIDQRCN